LLRNVKDVLRLQRWILRLAPFKFRVKHTRGVDNVVADALLRMFEGVSVENTEISRAALLESLPLVYSSLEEHQEEGDFCKDVLKKIREKQAGVESFKVHMVSCVIS